MLVFRFLGIPALGFARLASWFSGFQVGMLVFRFSGAFNFSGRRVGFQDLRFSGLSVVFQVFGLSGASFFRLACLFSGFQVGMMVFRFSGIPALGFSGWLHHSSIDTSK